MITRSMTSTNRMAGNGELKQLFDDLKKELCDKIDKLNKQLEEKDSKIETLEKRCELFERRLDDSEQYSRRTNLRINGIPYNGIESAVDSLNIVKEEIVKLGINLADCEFDRAHRVGFSKDKEGNPVKDRQMIVKFTSFRARSRVYQNRPKYENRNVEGVRFYIDQTKRRFNLKKMAIDYVKDKPNVDFCFVDINCSLCVRFKDGKFKNFSSHEELVNLVG